MQMLTGLHSTAYITTHFPKELPLSLCHCNVFYLKATLLEAAQQFIPQTKLSNKISVPWRKKTVLLDWKTKTCL